MGKIRYSAFLTTDAGNLFPQILRNLWMRLDSEFSRDIESPTMGVRDSKDLKVLLVEDFEDTRLFMRLELEDQGFIVFEAENGQVAVDTAIRENPDVILMDLTLPLMDGFTATKLIRQNEQLKSVPIIAVTAHQEDDFRSDAKASGFDAYVTKPIDANWLKELIAGLLT